MQIQKQQEAVLKLIPAIDDRQDQDPMPRSDCTDLSDRNQLAFAKMVVALLCVGATLFIALFLASGQPARLLGTVPFLVVGAAAGVLLKWGRLRSTCQVIVYGVWASSVNALFWTHGLTGTTIGTLVIALAFAGWLAGPAAAIILTAATPPVFFLLAYLEASGWPISIGASVTPYQRALLYSITALGGGLLGYFGAASLREHLARLVASKRDLSARLAEIQARDLALERSQQRFETLFRSGPNASAITNAKGRILDCNQAYADLVGRGMGDILGRTSLELGVWRNPVHRMQAYDLIQQQGRLNAFETEWVSGKGETRTVLIYGEPLELNQERCIVFHLADITERKQTENALKESQVRAQSIVEAAFDGVMTHDRGWILDANLRFARLFGYDSPADLIGRQGIDLLLAPESRAAIRARIAAGGPSEPLEVTGIRKDGSTFLGETQSSQSLHLGETVRTVTMRDITARRRAEEALRHSEHKFATLFNTVPDAIVVTRRRDGSIIEINPACERMLGYARERVLGNTGPALGVWADPAERAALLSRLDGEYAIVNCPVQFRHADGRAVDALVSAVRYDYLGEACILWTWTDVGELRAAEQALAQSERRYRSLFQAASDCILVIDREGRLLDINDKGSRTLGYSREELLGEGFTRVLDAHLLSRIYPRPAHVLAERRSVRGEQELVSRSGSRHFVEFVTNPLPDGNVLAIVRDVTERRQMEANVRELNASLELRVAERTAELQAANQELESFSYSVSHDLRAPLRAIGGFAGILRARHSAGLGDEAAGMLGRIETNVTRMNTLIDDLLEFSRAGRKELMRGRVDMRSAVDTVLADLRSSLPENAVIQVGELPAARGDASLLREVWQNLIGNAVKYSRHAQPARIEIGSVAGVGVMEYYVRDNGAGFDMTYAGKLFGVFQRLHAAEEFEGTGVGLAIVQRILARHGGRISAEGAPGKGATFRFTLPLTPACS